MSSGSQFSTDNEYPAETRVQDPGPGFNYRTLSSVLRFIGAGVLVASLSMMLFRGWDSGSDLTRFYTLLAYCAVLAGTGIFLSHIVHETKGARTFLALALGAICVNFTVLGALCLSTVDRAGQALPSFANWAVSDGSSVVLAAATACLVLSPIACFGFSVFARKSARRLTGLFLVTNAALLLPLRSSLLIGLLGLALIIVILRQLAVIRRSDNTFATREGRIAAAMPFIPVAILLGRNFYLYAIDETLLTLSALIGYAILREVNTAVRSAGTLATRLLPGIRAASALSVALGAAATIASVDGSHPLVLPIFTVVLAGLLADIGFTAGGNAGTTWTRTAAITLALGFLVNLVVWPTIPATIAAILTGAAIAIYGYSVEQKSVFISGGSALLSGITYQLQNVFAAFDFGSWSSLALIGIGAIVLASVLERHGLVLRNRLIAWRLRYSQWDH